MVIIKKIILVLFFSLFLSTFSNAAGQNIPTQIQTKFEQKVKVFYPALKAAATSLMYKLAVIELIIVFAFMALRGELELGGIMSEVVKIILIIGFFKWILESPSILKSIYDGFDSLGISAGNTSFDNIINKLFKMWDVILTKATIWEPAEAIGYFIVGVAATIALTILIGNALMIYGFTIFSIYVGVFWIGFAGYSKTRDWAINAIVNVVKWGAKWMMMLILMSVTFSLIDDALNENMDFNALITILVVSMIMVSIAAGITSFVDSYFTGMGGAENSRGMQLANSLAGGAIGAATGAVAGGVAGAKSAADTISAAKATDGGIGFGAGLKSAGQFAGGVVSDMVRGGYEGYGKGALGSIAKPTNGAQSQATKTEQKAQNNQQINTNQTINNNVDGEIS